MKRKDLILVCAVIFLAGALYLLRFLMSENGGTYAVAKVDGREAGRWSLAENTEADIDTPFGHNRIVIRDGKVRMEEADCPDGYCKIQGEIGGDGGEIICLPHHLIIEIAGAEENEYDTVAK